MSMPGWYDIKTLGDSNGNSKLHDPCDGIDDSRQTILQILDAEHSTSGVPYDRMMLAGFSQGGAMSLYTGLQVHRCCFVCHLFILHIDISAFVL
jgi:predicted esterase